MPMVEQMDILRHMLGMASNVPKKQWGFRNYFNAGAGPDQDELRTMLPQGLVENYMRDYWRATEKGMRAVGLPEKTIRTLLSSNKS